MNILSRVAKYTGQSHPEGKVHIKIVVIRDKTILGVFDIADY